jgi:hypothetical protein
MAKKAAKRPRGRPVTTGIRPSLAVRFSKEAADGIERFAKANKCSRSEAIRKLVNIALASLRP